MTEFLANEELEQGLLGNLLMNEESCEKAIEADIQPEHFFYEHNAAIFEVIQRNLKENKRIEPKLVASSFTHPDTQDYIIQLAQNYMGAFNTENYITELDSLYIRREAKEKYKAASRQLEKLDVDPEKIISETEHAIFKVSQKNTKSNYSYISQSSYDAMVHIEKCMRGEIPAGVMMGINRLDQILGGAQGGDLRIIAGRPAMGKTGLMLTAALKQAQNGMVPAVFSLEMPTPQLTQRILAQMSGISAESMRKGELMQEDFHRIAASQAKLAKLKIVINDKAAITVPEIMVGCRRLKRKGQLDVVYIDYLQLIKASANAQRQGKVQAISEISQELKIMAKELDVPVIALAQLSRAVEHREDKRPMLSDLRESGQIEQDADSVIFAYRDEYYIEKSQPQMNEKNDEEKYQRDMLQWQQRLDEAKGKAELIVGKNRHGRSGTAHVEFIAHKTEFIG